jgi:S-adenosylmethionine decarboxylase
VTAARGSIIGGMHGLHLTADLRECCVQRSVMTELDALRQTCLAAVRAAALTPVGELFHRFERAGTDSTGVPVGITGVVLLAESHLAVHTWPEIACVTLDVYVCNLGADNSGAAHALLAAMIDAFEPKHVQRHALQRGQLHGTVEALR